MKIEERAQNAFLSSNLCPCVDSSGKSEIEGKFLLTWTSITAFIKQYGTVRKAYFLLLDFIAMIILIQPSSLL